MGAVMENPVRQLPLGKKPPFEINCFVEIPKGCR